MDSKALLELRQLEESLWRAETRFDNALMAQLLAEDFIEFGRSGRIYTREEMFLAGKACSEIDATLPLPDFRAKLLSGEISQVTYTSVVRYGDEIERANRSSIWKKSGSGWQLVFHQGTAI